MCVLTAHGHVHVHGNVPPDTVQAIVEHDHPGYAYQAMRYEIGPKVSHLTPAGFLSAVRARRAFKGLHG
jgi:hypothetical protein